MSSNRWVIGADIGGTFTDLILVGPDGRLHVRKVSSTVDDYAKAIVDSVAAFSADLGIRAEEVAAVAHATTVATNTLLEGKGVKTGLLVTEGFRDILEIGRMRMPRLYDLTWVKPKPMVERRLRREIPERISARGEIVRPLDEDATREQIAFLLEEGVEAIAVCLIHAYVNPVHEQRVKAIIQEMAPSIDISLSTEVLPEIREYERMSTTVANATIHPVVKSYFQSLRDGLDRQGFAAPVWVMQSSGGVMSLEAAAEKPVQIIESGPAAGVVGASRLGAQQGMQDLITFDMGGTTAKASMVEQGEFMLASEQEIGSGMHGISRLLKGGGYLVRVPTIDVAEVGAGGGSIVWLDSGGAMRVGPQSAGAKPGPVAYNLGGTNPTVTDANLLLGYLNPQALAGGTLPIDKALSERVFTEKIARPSGLSLEQAAFGARAVANANMVRAVRAVSTERGRDPRQFTMVAFGGNGGVHGLDVAALIGIKRVVIPPAAGVFSALGLMLGPMEQHFVHSFYGDRATLDLAKLNQAWNRLSEQASRAMQAEGFSDERIALKRFADVRYVGQSFELTVPFPDGEVTEQSLERLTQAFNEAHLREYGHAATDEPIEIVSLRIIATLADYESLLAYAGGQGIAGYSERLDASGRPADGRAQSRRAYFGPRYGWVDTPVVYDRAAFKDPVAGPIILEEYDSTTILPPWSVGRQDSGGNIVIDLDLERFEGANADVSSR